MAKSLHAPDTANRPVRLIDVARYAQVSRATAARALADKEYVSPQTRQKVLSAADALSYEPNLLARGLRSGTTMSIGLVWSIAKMSPAAGVPQSIAFEIQEAGYTTHLANSLSDSMVIKRILADMLQRKVDGVVLLAKNIDDSEIYRLLRQFRTVVLVSSEPVFQSEFDAVFQNPEPAIRAVVDHFTTTGRQTLATLMPMEGNDFKKRVFVDQAAMHGCRVRHIVVQRPRGGVTGQNYQQALDECVSSSWDFDAMFCVPDEGAAKAASHLRRLNCRVPEDVAIVGYNDSTFAADFWPPLASVARHDDVLSELVVKTLLNRLTTTEHQSQGDPVRQEIAMDFVYRTSAG